MSKSCLEEISVQTTERESEREECAMMSTF